MNKEMLNQIMLNQIKKEVKRYINIEDTEALINKAVEEVELWENEYKLDADIPAIVYQLANDFDEWYE